MSRDLLDRLAGMAPPERPRLTGQGRDGGDLDLPMWLAERGLTITKTKPWRDGTLYELETCPWNPEHKKTARVIQFPTGALMAGCFHASCQRRRWPDLRDVLEPGGRAAGSSRPENPWAAALSAPDFIGSEESEQPFYEPNILAPGFVTEFFSPRGIGKTLVARSLAVKLARQGLRVLLLDRDNPRRATQGHLKKFGGTQAPTLMVIPREKVPPLTDAKSWQSFPYERYEVVIVDSLDSTTEGVGEHDSAKPSRALAPLLDIARRDGGPAVLILGNTVRSGAHSRGSGVIEDRADIIYELRDASDLKPTGRKEWWMELPPAGADAWAQRASRRRGRTTFRLAFVPTKFRGAPEPDPFVLELNLSGDPWTVRDVTGDVLDSAGTARLRAEASQRARLDEAASALADEIQNRTKRGERLIKGKAEQYLMDWGLTEAEARRLLADRNGQKWRISELTDQAGQPKVLSPVPAPQPGPTPTKELAAETPSSGSSPQEWDREGEVSAERSQIAGTGVGG